MATVTTYDVDVLKVLRSPAHTVEHITAAVSCSRVPIISRKDIDPRSASQSAAWEQ